MLHRFPCGAIEYGKIEMKFMSHNIHPTSYQNKIVHELCIHEYLNLVLYLL